MYGLGPQKISCTVISVEGRQMFFAGDRWRLRWQGCLARLSGRLTPFAHSLGAVPPPSAAQPVGAARLYFFVPRRMQFPERGFVISAKVLMMRVKPASVPRLCPSRQSLLLADVFDLIMCGNFRHGALVSPLFSDWWRRCCCCALWFGYLR